MGDAQSLNNNILSELQHKRQGLDIKEKQMEAVNFYYWIEIGGCTIRHKISSHDFFLSYSMEKKKKSILGTEAAY